MQTETAVAQHKIRWFRYTYDGESLVKIPRQGVSSPWGYDVTCSCGWESRSGGAIRAYIQEEIRWHKWASQ